MFSPRRRSRRKSPPSSPSAGDTCLRHDAREFAVYANRTHFGLQRARGIIRDDSRAKARCSPSARRHLTDEAHTHARACPSLLPPLFLPSLSLSLHPLSLHPAVIRAGEEMLDHFLWGRSYPVYQALLIDPDDCKLGHRPEADRARRANSRAIEKARGMDGNGKSAGSARAMFRLRRLAGSIHLEAYTRQAVFNSRPSF